MQRMRHLRSAIRTLAKSPFVTTVAVLSLALGIGANTAIYSLFDQMLLQALPVQEPDRLVNRSLKEPVRELRKTLHRIPYGGCGGT